MVVLNKSIPVDKTKLNQCTFKLPQNYNFEIEKIVNTITLNKLKRIAFQFPDGLLRYALIIVDTIKFMCDVEECIILGDVVYGACCVDDTSAYKLNCDILVHFGHSCLVPMNLCKVRCLYVFVDIYIDIEHAIKMIKKIAEERIKLDKKIDVKCNVLKTSNNINYENIKPLDDYFTNENVNIEDKNKEIIHEDDENIKNKDIVLYEKINHQQYENEFSKMAIVGTIQFNAAINVISKKLNIFVPQVKPLSRGEVLGCTSPFLGNKKICIYISDGRFHLESVMIKNTAALFYKYCPFTKKMTREYYDHEKMLANRKKSINKFFSQCKHIGIIYGILGRQGSTKIYRNISDYLKQRDFFVYKITLKEINETILDSLSFCDAFVQISCPRLSIDWGHNYKKPLLNPFEVFNHLDTNTIYEMDYYSKEKSQLWNNY
ncbi:diphthamide biosynthesis enzyme Dph1/Dph2 domain-containing protein [Edhazardia aedis USNM 41457]|uniref:2-(3-amino-3-carboxypropyl)histidine synthase subunit 1 n=1 Tax=Edhazardia aedis (strain USNM 41457) TaxID=1003232 RepID=J8ZVH7_EDHAE|nr:diphthamide biosynthesis enzyme Dph1/Dph2 domain-containing protein [Edhazardia aedis USNM 41457]|eukprot:EJW03648.1 diphthamide biosynthesis enzyme Dph1/Dph2 domain-containing protein [Edhazardia aedis USNM 41457]